MSAIIYLLQVSACLALFYGFYYLLLNRLTFFTINRYYLLFTLVISFAIPLLTIPVHEQYSNVPVMQQVVSMRSLENAPVANAVSIATPTSNPTTWMQLLKWGYLIAVAALFIHLLITLTNFFAKLKRRKISSLGNVHILRGDKKLPNGSFLNYIFLNDDQLSAEEMEQIVAHEMLHVKLFHSADRILIKLVQIILWFNPFVYLYARSMEENHEFEVDREIARSIDKTQYADLLLHLSVANQGMLYHSFSKVPLKKRIMMLFNQPSANMKKIIYVLVLPVLLISCLAFAKIKKADVKINLIKSGNEILTGIKTGQDNMVAQLNQPVELSGALLNTDSSKINLPLVSKVIDTTERFSALVGPGSSPIKKDAVITVDGKKYPTSIYYDMSPKGVIGISFDATTGAVAITTQNGKGEIFYLTAHEKDNIHKENTISRSKFFTRMPLTRENGERYDYVAVGGNFNFMGANRIAPDDKVGFIFDGVLYDENDLNLVPREKLSSPGHGFAVYKPDMLYKNKYKLIYTLVSSEYQQLLHTHNVKESYQDPSILYGAGQTNTVVDDWTKLLKKPGSASDEPVQPTSPLYYQPK